MNLLLQVINRLKKKDVAIFLALIFNRGWVIMLYQICNKNVLLKSLEFEYNNIVMTSPISITISCITLIILLFILINQEWLSIGTILVQVLFNT